MVVQHNLTAMNANRQLSGVTSAQAKSTEKLSSGYRINRAADDAAGLSISEKLRSQIRGLDKAASNSQDGISLVQVAEGALNETHSILQRMNELATQAANDTNTSTDRASIQKEMDQLTSEIDRIRSTTQFNSMNLLDGTFKNMKLQVGALSGQSIVISIDNMNASSLKISGLKVSSFSSAGKAMAAIQKAINSVSVQRSSLVLFRTDLSIQLTTLTQQVRIHQQLNHVSVTWIWLQRWLNTARITFLHRLDSLCLHRLISRHRVYFHFSVNNYYYYKQKSWCLHQLFLFIAV